MTRVIAFTGLKGSGKDTAARALIDDGYTHVKMAGALKGMLAEMMRYQGAPESVIEAALEGSLKEVPTALLGGRSPRHAMQTLGTEWGREMMASDIWTSMTAARCRLFPAVVISDVRFPNEVEMVRQLGGRVFRIQRFMAPSDTHASETLIAGLKVDGEIVNDHASAEAFYWHVRETFRQE